MKTKNVTYRSFIFLFISLFTLVGCQPKSTPTEEFATNSTPTTTANTSSSTSTSIEVNKNILLDPAITQDADSLTISSYLYEGLTTLNSSNQPQPGVAESWVISDDQLDYVFTLRPGATFSNGTPITPDVIVENFNRWLDPQHPLHGNNTFTTWEETFFGFLGEKDENGRAKSSIDGIQKVDSNTVLLHLTRITPEVLTYLANPAFAIQEPNSLALSGYGKQGSNPPSSGAYKVLSWTNTELILTANATYWGEIPNNDLSFILK